MLVFRLNENGNENVVGSKNTIKVGKQSQKQFSLDK